MSKIAGKVLAICISPSGATCVEGEFRNSEPYVSQYFTVANIEDYFERVGSNYQISSVAGLVASICTVCQDRRVATKRVLLCSDVLGITTSIEVGSSKGNIKETLMKPRGSGVKDHSTRKDDSQIESKVDWGEIIVDGKKTRISTVSVGEVYLLRTLADEFRKHGFDVERVCDTSTALMNLKYTEASDFDSQGKLVYSFNERTCDVVYLLNDTPLAISSSNFTRNGIVDLLSAHIKESESKVSRNPMVFICGPTMADCDLYNSVVNELQQSFNIVDLFDSPMRELDENTGELTEVFSADYTAALSLVFSTANAKPVNVLPPVPVGTLLRRNGRKLSAGFLALSVIACAGSSALAGARFFELQKISRNPTNLSSLESTLTSLGTTKSNLESTIDILTKSDTTILQVIDFVSSNQSADVHVISIDTEDMLYQTDVEVEGMDDVDESNIAEGGTEETVVSSGPRENIIIRGYARSGSAAINYYNRLFNIGLNYDPVLNGVEKYALPDASEVYIFEIQIGGGAE